MSAVDEISGILDASEVVAAAKVSKGYTGFKEEDVLFAKITPCMENGKAAIARGLAGGIGFGSTEFHVLRASRFLSPEYLFLYVRQEDFRRRAKLNFVGSGGHMRVPESFLEQSSIPLPSLSEQNRIVEILREAETVRRHQAQATRIAAELIPALFQGMFGDPINNPRNADKIPLERFVAEFEGGKSLSDESSGSSPYRVLRISAVTSGEFQPEESKPAPQGTEPESHHFVRRGDLLISRANTEALVGATAYVRESVPAMLLSDKLWRFVFRDPSRQETEFIYHLFQHPSVRKALSARASGTGGSMKNIGKGRLLSMHVALPTIEAQRRFLAVVAELTSSSASDTLTIELYAALLAHAFNGSLTAHWREQNAATLAPEAASRDAALAASGIKTVTLVAANQDLDDQASIWTTPADGAWSDLTASQRSLWRYIPAKAEPFGIEALMHARDKEPLLAELTEDGFRRELEVFVARGLLVHISRPEAASNEEREVFRHYYRKVRSPVRPSRSDETVTGVIEPHNAPAVRSLVAYLRNRLTS